MFIDKVKIYVESGSGGNGCMSFRREKFVPLGGPDGGNGGKGGDVYLCANSQLTTLYDFYIRPHYKAQNGFHGKGNNMSGKQGEDLLIEVPSGTVVYEIDNVTKEKKFVADLKTDKEKILIVSGGRGGRGNASFKTSVNRAPKISELGEPGKKVVLELELKLIADVGIIGLPNAGKSTLLSVITSAKPKIADYPFTTLSPNLGICVYKDSKIIFADIPGLIENAHLGKGLGTDFLRHIERTKFLVHMIDISNLVNNNVYETYKIILKELKNYSLDLIKKPFLVVLNKIDVVEKSFVLKTIKDLRNRIGFKVVVLPISTITKENIEILLDKIVIQLNKIKNKKFSSKVGKTDYKLFEYIPDIIVEKKEDKYIVSGDKIYRLVKMTNFDQEESITRLQKIIKKLGVEKRLKQLGIKHGDKVNIYDFEFDYYEDN